jgi:Zn-dependent protease with chaperone function
MESIYKKIERDFSGAPFLLRAQKFQEQIGFVIAHELAHCILRHSNERVSLAAALETFKFALTSALMLAVGGDPGTIMAMGIGLDFFSCWEMLVNLPYSRLHELEADHLGLLIASAACFGTDGGIDFFHFHSEVSKGAAVAKPNAEGGSVETSTEASWYSTHPSDAHRESALLKHIEENKSFETNNKECESLKKELEKELEWIVKERSSNFLARCF